MLKGIKDEKKDEEKKSKGHAASCTNKLKKPTLKTPSCNKNCAEKKKYHVGYLKNNKYTPLKGMYDMATEKPPISGTGKFKIPPNNLQMHGNSNIKNPPDNKGVLNQLLSKAVGTGNNVPKFYETPYTFFCNPNNSNSTNQNAEKRGNKSTDLNTNSKELPINMLPESKTDNLLVTAGEIELLKKYERLYPFFKFDFSNEIFQLNQDAIRAIEIDKQMLKKIPLHLF